MLSSPKKGDRHHQLHHKTGMVQADHASDSTEQRLISFPNMGRVEEVQIANNIKQQTTSETFTSTKIGSNFVPPGIKNRRFEMLDRASQIT